MLISTHAFAEKTYTVEKGDTLYKISKKFKTSVEDIIGANNLAPNELFAGTKLIIPSKEVQKVDSSKANGTPSIIALPANAAADSLLNDADQQEPISYQIKKGDTLTRIAKNFSMSVADLKELNNLKSDKLKLGQVLLLEKQSDKAEAVSIVQMETARAENPKDTERINELINTLEPQSSKLKELLFFVARQTLGIPYRFGSNTFLETDCSGYVQNVFNILGINLPRSAREQFHIGESVKKEDLSIGDLVFFKTYASFPSHVGIYLGNDLFIHASRFGKKVTIDSLSMPYFVKRFIGAKRLPGFDESSAIDFPQS
jgi:cell wall-associated NlpC family hydrolase